MTISMKVLWRLKLETFSTASEAAVPASVVVSLGEDPGLLSLSLVSLADGGRTAVSLLSSAGAAEAAVAGASTLSSDLTSEESKALVLLANTPKSIKVDVRLRTTSHTRVVHTFSRNVILCRAYDQ